MKKILFLAVLVSAFFTACGGDSGSKGSDPEDGVGRDSTDQGGDKKPLPDIPALAIDSVDTEDDLTACVSSNEGDSVYVKAAYSIFRCDDELWKSVGFVLQRAKTKDKLPKCNRDLTGLMVLVADSSVAWRCVLGEWVEMGKAYKQDKDLPNCTSNRVDETVFVESDGSMLVCDGRWREYEPEDKLYCGSRSFDPAEEFCMAEKLYDLCGDKDFDPAMQFCYEDSLYALCGGEEYRPTRRFCVRDTLYDMCGGKDFDPAKKFCIDDELHDLCGGKSYDVDRERCEGGKVLGICGTETYDAGEKFCSGNQTYDLCGGKKYDIAAEFCSGNLVYSKCEGSSYDVTAKFCSGGQTYDLCGGASYDVTEKFCSDSKIYDLCDGKEYDVTVKFCVDNQTYDLCGGKEYDVETESCVSGKIYGVCGMILYDKSLKFCSGSQLYDLCGGLEYDVEEASCVDGEVKSCNTLTYDKTTHFCDKRNARVYRFVTIGTQTWMAENLNYADSVKTPELKGNTWCYKKELNNCVTYGRLYTWSMAKRYACPSGWHLPSKAEWETLIVTADGLITEYNSSNVAGKKLKATDGWNKYSWASSIPNEDAFGFTALPAGEFFYGDFYDDGLDAYFWSATENMDISGNVYYMCLYHNYDHASVNSISHSYYGYSVRCLKD